MCRLRDDESTMERKEYHENPDEIECERDEKYRKTERKESSLSGESRISEEYDREQYINPKSDDRTKCRLKYLMK